MAGGKPGENFQIEFSPIVKVVYFRVSKILRAPRVASNALRSPTGYHTASQSYIGCSSPQLPPGSRKLPSMRDVFTGVSISPKNLIFSGISFVPLYRNMGIFGLKKIPYMLKIYDSR